MATNEESKLENTITKKLVLEQPYEQSPGSYDCTAPNENGIETQVTIELWDASGAFECDRLEPLKYTQASVIVVAYPIDWPHYFELTEERWLPELDHSAPGVPIILVGLQKDRRDDADLDEPSSTKRFISKKEGDKLARRIRAVAFIECSSVTGEGVEEVFEAAARAALCGPKRKNVKQKKLRARWRLRQCVLRILDQF
ncbi:P-loop containing nucleoside triphosphate hydrolase protein [Dactylonectria estremocensis]|uniref:P-loop containing nucleoside triphosphate hydrolase protein n=1 Tax=Dactylonectria estremocensis TaxID=1079267 RepID=A0A9P9EXS7_9HYPO|nr:P-loop containing nucleoside triphosphate hydrolase protein [Dactylonectria estremocensis]